MPDAITVKPIEITVAELSVKQDAMKEQNDRMEKTLDKVIDKMDSLAFVHVVDYEADKKTTNARIRTLTSWTVGAATTFLFLIVVAAIDIAARNGK
jgi:hypothetical protein